MKDLKYSEILLRNQSLSEEIKGTQYKVKVLANITTHSMKEILEYALRVNQISPVIEFGNYDNIVQDSALSANMDLVIVFFDMLTIISGVSEFFEDMEDESYHNVKNKIFSEIKIILKNLKNCPSVIFNTFSPAGFVSGYVEKSRIETLADELNTFLEDMKEINVTLMDIGKIISRIGTVHAFDFRLNHSSKAPYTLSFYKHYISAVEPVILKNTGKLKKAIIFDCDNTLWKGIVGEDGFEGIEMSSKTAEGSSFRRVQQIAVFLSKHGVIVGLCSRNNEPDVLEVITKHPDMVLREEHLVIKKINWDDKATNLRSIASELNIGLDSIIFVDDSSFEINLIKDQIPEITLLQVPASLFEYHDFLLSHVYKYFNLSQTGEDVQKTLIYKEQFLRESSRDRHETIHEYLSSLKIVLTIYHDERKLIPRASQLTQKTNQFNLTTRRYTENQIQNFMESDANHVIVVSVKDVFGDSGVTALAIITTDPQNKSNAVIDTFQMSCRIIGRNIEYSLMDYIMNWLGKNHFLTVSSEFIPTRKNSQVDRFYDSLGFSVLEEKEGRKRYLMNISDYKMKNFDYLTVKSFIE